MYQFDSTLDVGSGNGDQEYSNSRLLGRVGMYIIFCIYMRRENNEGEWDFDSVELM